MNQPNPSAHSKNKLKKNYWSVWFPYPSSWLRALILASIALPGTRLILFGFAGALIATASNNLLLLIFCLIFGVLLPTIILSFPYHLFWYMWRKQPSSKRWPKWVPGSSSLWEAFYATVVVGLSFLLILAIFTGIYFFSCKLSHHTGEELAGCLGRGAGRAAQAMLSATDNALEVDGTGVVTKQAEIFVIKPWFFIWLVVAAYLYQLDCLIRRRLFPWLKAVLTKYQRLRKG